MPKGVFHVKHEGWREAAADLGVPLDERQAGELDLYEALLVDRGTALGIVSQADVPRIRERHILDSLRLAAYVGDARSAYDFGSGGGLPGIPLAIASPGLTIVLVEARRGRVAFLELVLDALALPNASAHLGRVDELQERVDLITARAFSDARTCWRMAEPLLEPGGRLVYFAGNRFDPANEAPDRVDMRLFTTPSLARSGPLAIMGRQ